jgi:hypothetical protein
LFLFFSLAQAAAMASPKDASAIGGQADVHQTCH